MIRKDWLMTQFEQLTMALAKIADFRETKESGMALDLIRSTGQEYCGVQFEMLDYIRPQDLRKWLDQSSLDSGALFAGAHLIKVRAELMNSSTDVEKALILFLMVSERNQPGFQEASQVAIHELSKEMVDCSRVYPMLIEYFERLGQYAEAENILFQIPQTVDWHSFATSFYDRLESKTDEDLSCGNLPREEVREVRVKLNLGILKASLNESASIRHE